MSGVGGSNPLVPTKIPKKSSLLRLLFYCLHFARVKPGAPRARWFSARGLPRVYGLNVSGTSVSQGCTRISGHFFTLHACE
ncbi:hypothetical protein F3J36_10795 [Pantoea sp. Cy-640]|nr:hypothetical protein [Pantoea sp. Cy-640]